MNVRPMSLAPLLALATFAATTGCAPDASVQVQALCYPTEDCTFKSKCDMQFIGYPTVDLDTTSHLWAFLQISNQLVNNADKGTWRVNTNDAHIDVAAIEYEGARGGTQEIPSNYWVPAGGTAVVSVLLDFTGAASSAVGVMSVAHVRMQGYFEDGTRFETGDFPVPVVVCTGCLPADPCAGAPACPGLGQLPVACGT